MKKKVIIIASIVMVGLIGLAVAGGASWHGAKSAEYRISYIKDKMADTLELTETQVAAMDRMAEDMLAEHDRMAARRGEFKERLIEVLNRDSIAPEDLVSLFEEKKPDIDHLVQLASNHVAEFHSLLTPEQRARLITEMENHHGRCGFGR